MVDYRYKPNSNFKIDFNRNIIYGILGLIGIIILFYFSVNGYQYLKTPLDVTDYPKELALSVNYVPIRLVAIGTSEMVLGTDCKQVLIPITQDQAFSISEGLTNDFVKPLTHDIYITTLEHFDIKPVRFTIDNFHDNLWDATLRLQKGFDILDLDIRPSDGVGISVRHNLTIYIDNDTFEERSRNVC